MLQICYFDCYSDCITRGKMTLERDIFEKHIFYDKLLFTDEIYRQLLCEFNDFEKKCIIDCYSNCYCDCTIRGCLIMEAISHTNT